MALLWRHTESSFVLSGEVCSIRLTVSFERQLEEDVWRLLGEEHVRASMHSEVLAVTHQSMGPEFDLRRMTFGRGTIEILVTIGAVYYAVSRYKNFVESVDLFVSQLTGVVKRFFERLVPSPAAVSAMWQPGVALAKQQAVISAPTDTDWAFPLLWYVILSHAALLALFIWLVARR